MTVGEMLDRMSSTELTYWHRFAQIEPFGGPVDDFRAGLGPAVNINLNRKEDADVITPFDLMPWQNQKAEEPELTPEEEAAALRAMINRAAGAK